MSIARLAVYCGSASGSQPVFAACARATAQAMVDAGVDLVFGGGRLGLMGLIADRTLDLQPTSGHLLALIGPDRGGVVEGIVGAGKLKAEIERDRPGREPLRKLVVQVVTATLRGLLVKSER